MNDTVPTTPPPTPTERLLDALDPQGDIDYGLAIAIAHDLPSDALLVLAELVDKRVSRATADAYDRGYTEGRAT